MSGASRCRSFSRLLSFFVARFPVSVSLQVMRLRQATVKWWRGKLIIDYRKKVPDSGKIQLRIRLMGQIEGQQASSDKQTQSHPQQFVRSLHSASLPLCSDLPVERRGFGAVVWAVKERLRLLRTRAVFGGGLIGGVTLCPFWGPTSLSTCGTCGTPGVAGVQRCKEPHLPRIWLGIEDWDCCFEKEK